MITTQAKYSKITATIALTLLALTGCTTASQSADGEERAGEAAFNPADISVDEELAAQVPADIKSKGVLVFGSDTSYAPAEYLGGADGQTPMGYDVDMAKAIGATLGLDVEVKTSEFTGILPALGAKYDLGVSSFFITNERSKAANFVSYFQAGTQWTVETGNPQKIDIEDLCGKSVGVQTGTFQEDPDITARNAKCLEAGKEAINVVSLKNQTDVTTRLMTGGIDAMAAGSIVAAYAVTQSEGKLETLGDVYGASPVGIAVAKDNMPLAEVVQKATNKLIADGDYQEILDSWGTGAGAIDEAQINPEVTK